MDKVWNELTDKLEDEYHLIYIDYRDSLDEHPDLIQRAIKEKEGRYVLSDQVYEWCLEGQSNTAYDIALDIIDEYVDEHEVTEEEAGKIGEMLLDELRNTIHELDQSDPVNDLLRNTRSLAAFIELETYVYEFGYDEEENANTLAEMKEELGLVNNDQYDDQLREIAADCYGGGQLVVYFTIEDIEEFIAQMEDEPDVIKLTNPNIAVVNHAQGSGWHTMLDGHEVSFSFNRSMVWIDKTIKYNYTHAVCGMDANAYEDTDVQFEKTGLEFTPEESNTARLHKQDQEYKSTYEAGGCTKGDTDMNRHRDVFYKNEYPCGWHCPHCDMFWIDQRIQWWEEGEYTKELFTGDIVEEHTKYVNDRQDGMGLREAAEKYGHILTAGIAGSDWATPVMSVEFLDGTDKYINCFTGESDGEKEFEDGIISAEVNQRRQSITLEDYDE